MGAGYDGLDVESFPHFFASECIRMPVRERWTEIR